MAITETTESNIPLNEAQLEKKVGDLGARFNLASELKYYDEQRPWGPITIDPVDDGYHIFDIDGFPQAKINARDREVEQLAQIFDQQLEDALNAL